MATWTASARIAERTFVSVDAETEEEALQKFKDMDWLDGWAEIGEIVDWKIAGRFKKDPE